MLTQNERNFSIMAHSNIWSDVSYQVVVGDTLVKATIPQKALCEEPFTGIKTVPPMVVALLRSPSPEHKIKLRAVYGVKVQYIPVISTGNSTISTFEGKEAA